MTMEEKDLYELLVRRHPFFQRKTPPQTPYDEWGLEIGLGWYPLIIEWAEYAEELGVVPVIDDIKEKFFMLRVYFNVLDDDESLYVLLDEKADELELRSSLICQQCGKKHDSQKAARYCRDGVPVIDPDYPRPTFEETPYFYYDEEYDDEANRPPLRRCSSEAVIELVRAKLTNGVH